VHPRRGRIITAVLINDLEINGEIFLFIYYLINPKEEWVAPKG